MINTTIETFRTECGCILYRGVCVVQEETVSAGVVVNAEIPDGPACGFERVTLKWKETRREDGAIGRVAGAHAGGHPTYSSRVEFEILDKRKAT